MVTYFGEYNTSLSGYSENKSSLYNTSMVANVGGYNTSLSGYSETNVHYTIHQW